MYQREADRRFYDTAEAVCFQSPKGQTTLINCSADVLNVLKLQGAQRVSANLFIKPRPASRGVFLEARLMQLSPTIKC
jgi:hypothetical protein